MDTLTHVVLGAAVGEALMGKQIGKKAMLWGALAANAPDLDGLATFFVSDIDSIIIHRGITHSLFVALIFGPFAGWVLWKGHRMRGLLLSWILLFTSNLVIHDLLDTCTVYGTGLFSPVSEYRFSWDNIFVADPLYTLPLLISGIALLILSRNHHSRSAWNKFGLITSSVYLLFTFNNHSMAVNALNKSLDEKGIQNTDYFATPTLFNNFLWNVVASDSTGYWIGYYSVFDGSSPPELSHISRNEHLLTSIPESSEIGKLKDFSRGFYCVTEFEGKVWFNVMRFGQIGGWENASAQFAFAFDLSKGADNSMVVQQGRIRSSTKYMLNSMWQRIQGK